MGPVEIDVDAGEIYRPTHPELHQPVPRTDGVADIDTSGPLPSRAMVARALAQQNSITKPRPGPPSNASSGNLSKKTGSSYDEYDEGMFDPQQDDGSVDGRSSVGSSGPNQRPNHLRSSFNIDQMMANGNRDSLYVGNNGRNNHRQTEYGSALMRMDDGYRASSVNARRTSAAATIDGLTPLLQAARVGDIVMLNSLIIQPGTDILRRDPVYGQTALHFGIRGGHLAIVQALLMPEIRGSIVNVPDSRRNTALHLAAAKSRRMARVLIEAGADVNFVNMRNQTPLGVHILTVNKDDPTMTEILLQAGANPNASVDKSTALHVALDKKFIQIAQRLVRHGARLDLKDENGHMVFEKVPASTLKLLVSNITHAPVWIPDEERKKCMECKKEFGSIGTRRHHCRFCGRLLCSKCTSCHLRGSQIPFRQRKKKNRQAPHKNQRVCSMCYEVNTQSNVANPNVSAA